MPVWLYEIRPLYTAIVMVIFVETVSMIGLFITRRWVLPHLRYHDGINDAVSGTVQAIGVFYGITVGLIAVGVWNTNANASDLVSKEASAIGGLYRDISGFPTPPRDELRAKLAEYTAYVVQEEWPAQKKGVTLGRGLQLMNEIQIGLFSYDPKTPGQVQLYGEAVHAFNVLTDARRLRLNAVSGGLSGTMWAVIWIGAVISIGIAYFYKIDDPKFHALLVAFMGGFLAIVLFMIIINDKPFYGSVSVSPEPYQIILEKLQRLGK